MVKETQLQKASASIARMTAKAVEREAVRYLQLPLWSEHKRGAPNSFLRSALFSAVQGKDRRYINGEVLASLNGITVRYTGMQLNQEDLTLWETLVHNARMYNLGYSCTFTAYSLLRNLGQNTGGENYDRLHKGIIRLTACAVEIEHEQATYAGPLVKSSVKEHGTAKYMIELNRELIRLYGDTLWTAIDWNQREELRRQPLAQALHGFYSTHREPYPMKVETIKGIMGSRNSQAAGFKRQLMTAMDELVSVGFLKQYEIKDDLVTVSRNS